MEPQRPEIHALLLRPFMDDTRDELGESETTELLASIGLSAQQIEDPNAWVSLQCLESVFEKLHEVRGDPSFFERCGRMALTQKYAGWLRPLFRAFGSTEFAYDQVAKATERFNKVGRMLLEERRSGFVRIKYVPHPDGPTESSPLVCRVRAANLGAIPTLFDLAPGVVRHLSCLHEGDGSCTYEITYQQRGTQLWTMLGLALGGAFGGLFAWLAGVPVEGSALAVVGFAIAGAALGRLRELARDLGERAQDVAEQQEALTRSAQANEQRFAELMEAKGAVEEKVAQRTAELEATSTRLEHSLSEIQALDRAKTQFFSNVSHDLRTPLTLILGPLEELRAGREPPGGIPVALDVMHRNTVRLLDLINQLLDLAKVDAGAMRLDREPVDPGALALTVVGAFRAAAEARDIELRLELGEDLTSLPLDAAWVESAITNLVANALRFVEAGGHVVVGVQDRGTDCVIIVSDDGPGISESDLPGLFERFTQVGETGGRQAGTGLGLAIVREAARLHGGEAAVASERGGGTTFTLTFPRVVDASPSARGEGGATSATTALAASVAAAASSLDREENPDREGPSPDAPLVLVVEDNADLRNHIADVLAVDYRVRTARDGAEGLELATDLRPAIVVSDVAMPEMDGFELCRRLRASDATRATPILLVTAYRDVGRILVGFDAGATDYITKPFHGRELLARVGVHVRLREMVRELAHRERLATLGTVAASVAHQVRNPLTSILSGLPAIRERLGDRLDASSAQMWDVMVDCAKRIERMTTDLLDVSRVDRAEMGDYHPGAGVEAAARLLGPSLPDGVRLVLNVATDPVLTGRPADMNHVFLNLLDNAVRAVGERGEVRVQGFVRDSAYVVEVGDSGPGIPEADRARAFEPFWTSRPSGQGTGLGLSIAQQVVAQHGGRIEIGDSELGGALLRVVLPGVVQASKDGVLAYVPYRAPTGPGSRMA